MDCKVLADQIVEHIGGKENIATVAHCATRLRLSLKDNAKFEEEEIKKLDGVINILKSAGQFQIIIGPQVNEVYKEISAENVGGFEAKGKKIVFKDILMSIAQFMGACMGVAIIPLIGAGLIKAILTILLQFNLISADSNTYTVLFFAADAIRVFIPIFLAIGAARKLGANEILAVLVACIMISPTFISLVGAGASLTIFGLPIAMTDYSGTYLPVIFSVVVMAYLERLLKKILPKGVQMLLIPFLIVLIMTPVSLCATGPLANLLAQLIAKPIIALSAYGWLVVTLLACLMPILIMFGLHGVIVAFLMMTFYATLGYDPYFMVASLCAHFAIGTVAIAVAIKSKKQSIKTIGYTSGTTMLFGNVSEPAIFGILLQSRVALISACVAAGIAGLFAGLVGLKCFVIAGASVFFIPCFVGEGSSLFSVLITCGISIVVSFFSIMFFYKDPKDYEKTVDVTV